MTYQSMMVYDYYVFFIYLFYSIFDDINIIEICIKIIDL